MLELLPTEEVLIGLIAKGQFLPATDDCNGCGHLRSHEEAQFCKTYASPQRKWELGMCNFATHKRIEKTEEARSLNPLKASKRGGR